MTEFEKEIVQRTKKISNNKILNDLSSKFMDESVIPKYSYNFQKTPYLILWNKKYNLGVCGDWLNGPKVENAWLSANDLARKIK